MAIVLTLQKVKGAGLSKDQKIDKHFSGKKSIWRKPYNNLLAKIHKFGSDVSTAPTNSYISLLRKGRKFGIVQVTLDRMDIGIKLKGAAPAKRFGSSGSWNSMVTHRVNIMEAKQIDDELIEWLRQAYENA